MLSLRYLFHCLLSSNSYPTMEANADGRRQLMRIRATVGPFVFILISFERKTQSDTTMHQQGFCWNGISSVFAHYWVNYLGTPVLLHCNAFSLIQFKDFQAHKDPYFGVPFPGLRTTELASSLADHCLDRCWINTLVMLHCDHFWMINPKLKPWRAANRTIMLIVGTKYIHHEKTPRLEIIKAFWKWNVIKQISDGLTDYHSGPMTTAC